MQFIKNAKNAWNLQLPLLVTLFSVASFLGCGGCSKGSETPSAAKGGKKAAVEGKIIVLLHGLDAPNDAGIQQVADKLGADFPAATKVINLKRQNSKTAKMDTQAQEACQALIKLINDEGLQGRKLFIIGSSQGGLLAVALYARHQAELQVSGIITISAPLEGAPIANVQQTNIDQINNGIDAMFPGPGAVLQVGAGIIKTQLDAQFKSLQNITDLQPNSPFIQQIRATLNTITIPVLVIGGQLTSKDLVRYLLTSFLLPEQGAFLNGLFNILDTKPLKSAFNTLIGDAENDGFIPTSSQVAKNIQVSGSVTRKIAQDFGHFDGIGAIYNEIKNFIAAH